MTRKDYELIARVINDVRMSEGDYGNDWPTLDNLSDKLAGAFAVNDKFQPERFLTATGNARPVR